MAGRPTGNEAEQRRDDEPWTVAIDDDRPSGAAERSDEPGDAAAGSIAYEVASTTADWLRSQPWMLSLTKAGWAAKALVYGAIGWAAFVIPVRWEPLESPDHDAEYTGIVALLAERAWSRVLLAVVAVGLVLYVAFRVVSILLIDTGGLDAMAHRVAYAVSAGTYAVVAWAAVDDAITGPRPEGGGSNLERYSAELMTMAVGRIALGLGAVGALAIAGYFVVKGVTRRFVRQLDIDGLAPTPRRFLIVTGAIGWVGRAVVVAAVAGFVLWAAIQADPSDVRGLDRALHRLAYESTLGTVAVFATGALLLVYAAYCLASTPYRCLAWSDRCDPTTSAPADRGDQLQAGSTRAVDRGA